MAHVIYSPNDITGEKLRRCRKLKEIEIYIENNSTWVRGKPDLFRVMITGLEIIWSYLL